MNIAHLGARWPNRYVSALMLALLASAAQAQGVVQCPQVPCDDVRTVATVATGVPVEHDFTATAGTTYYVTLTDLGPQFATPQPLASLKLAITANDALVSLTPIITTGRAAATNNLIVEGANAVTTTGSATASFTAATTGSYRIHIIGAPATGNGPGPIGTLVSGSQNGPALSGDSWSDLIALPGTPLPATEGILEQSVTVTTAGMFKVSISDLDLPQALQAPPVLIVIQNGSSVASLPDPNNNGSLTKTVMLSAGTVQVFAVGLAAPGAAGGLFTVSIIPATTGGGAPASAWAVPVGSIAAVGGVVQLSAGNAYNLSVSDLAFPAPLSQVIAVAVDLSQGTQAALVTGPGTAAFTAAGPQSDTYQIYAAATAPATPGAGSYSALILPASGPAVTGAAQAVTATGSTLQAFSFSVNVPSPASAPYKATLTDFQIPTALGAAYLGLVQGGALVGTPTSSPGSISAANLTTGPLTVLAFASSSASAGSLMDLSITDANGNVIFDQPQGIGAAFKSTQISISTKGSYQFSLTDLDWPASFSQTGGQLTGVLTQGGMLLGEFFGGGGLSSIPVSTAGTYYLNIIATPTGSDQAGTYALNVGPTPAAPTVTLTADSTTVSSGGTVHLIWTSSGATSCAASGGGWSGTFTGAQAASGTATSPAITANSTFTFTCTGAGGQTAASVTVNLAASAPAKSGGGGALGEGLLLMLGGYLVLRRHREARR
jgi:hypothetical protein